MTPFECHSEYLAVKLHFTQEKFDYFKYGIRKFRASKKTWNGRRDQSFFHSLSRYNPDIITKIFVANFAYGCDVLSVDGIADKKYMEAYNRFVKHTNQMSQVIKEDLEYVNKKLSGLRHSIYSLHKGSHPGLLKAVLRKDVSMEFLIILNHFLSGVLFRYWDQTITADEIIWPDLKFRMQKLEPFLNIDYVKLKPILTQK